jgi:large subunit ribosomal protein L15
MARRLPKRGFNNPFRKDIFAVNLGDIAARFETPGIAVGIDDLKSAGLVPRSAKLVKVLGEVREGQKLADKLTVSAHYISASAKEKLVAAKGSFNAVAVRVKATSAE